ncbi:kinase-like domain-containing protein [Aspergillus pseudonomiae]|nr:kinase-like domain-containing protein [Aspergillus pseudonomiae]
MRLPSPDESVAKRLCLRFAPRHFASFICPHRTGSIGIRVLSTGRMMPSCSDLFDYTSGRWMYNDALRHRERRRVFNVPELKRLAASSIRQKEEDVVAFEKLAEGGFNRSFLITMRDNFQFVARIPYPVIQPKSLLIASQVATMDFLRSHGLPVPEVYSYSASADNRAQPEYIFMELVQGQSLGDIWFDLSEKQRTKLIAKLVQLQSRSFALRFPASGSIYYSSDLPGSNKVILPNQERLAFLNARAKKEIVYRSRFGKPLQPFARLRRDTYNYQPQSHLDYIGTLKQYLQIATNLIPHGNSTLHCPVLRHPDLQPNNIFVSDELEISGLIDWQHRTILPLFLQCAIPDSLQNYGDDAELFRKRQLHYLYVKMTSELNPEHYNALAYNFSVLRRRILHYASDPWEGDNVTLKSNLIALSRKWVDINGGNTSPCPLMYSDTESNECLRLAHAQAEADEQLKICQDLIGYEGATARERTLKRDALNAAETAEERTRIQENWIFDDLCEDDYM